MILLPTTLLATALLLPILRAPAEMAERGCSTTRNGLVVPAYTSSLMLDGVLLGDSPGVDQHFPKDVVIADLDILHMWIGCLEVQRDGRTIGVRLLSIITTGGAVGVMTSQLENLVAAQEAYRISTGSYAHAVADLDFLASHPAPPIEVMDVDGRWTATMRIGREGTSCVGTAVVHTDRSAPPEVTASCQAIET